MNEVTSYRSSLLHADVVDLLARWSAPSAQQESTRLAFLEHLAAHPEGIWRECQPGHITASTIVINHDKTEVLLTLHKKLTSWLQLGGHCELTDTTLHGAASREALEESGIGALVVQPEPVRLDWQAVPCHPGGSFHLDVQFAVPSHRPAPPPSDPRNRMTCVGSQPLLYQPKLCPVYARSSRRP